MTLKSLVLCASLISSPCWALVPYGIYSETKDDPRSEAHISGLIHGVSMTNAQMKVVTGQSLFCLQSGFSVDAKFANQVIEASATFQPSAKRKDAPIAALLLGGLIRTFPC